MGEGCTGDFTDRLARLESRVDAIDRRLIGGAAEAPRAWYTTAEVARLVGRAEFTVRAWCRLGRVRASKRPAGRGRSREWGIAREELDRLRDEGLLPAPG